MATTRSFRTRLRRLFPVFLALGGLMWLGEGKAIGQDAGPKEKKGSWSEVIHLPKMQAVHAALLPNGKVLLVSGSGNRDQIDNKGEQQEGVDVHNYDVNNNTCLFDPETLKVKRIASPPATRKVAGVDHANDLFCGHKIHLYNGNVLFVSGTLNYYPKGDFTGNRLANIYNWKTGKWQEGGTMGEGHWYPTPVPLADGRIVVFGGISSQRVGDFTSIVDFYDPRAAKGKRWSSLDIKKLPNSPFNRFVPGTVRPDRLDLYPRIHAIPDGRFVITGHGAGGGVPNSKQSYFMKIPPVPAGGKPTIAFTVGPVRKTIKRTYVGSCNDPNSPAGDILITGGQEKVFSIDHGPGKQAVGDAQVVAYLERMGPAGKGKDWTWEVVPNFLGKTEKDVRIMHWMVILPTKQILVIGGGNYSYYRPVLHPVLMTFDPKAPGKYRTAKMAPGQSPRLYHNTALLLPDGRVLLAGGNPHRAIRDTVTGKVIRGKEKFKGKTFNAFSPGIYENKPPEPEIYAEQWDLEVYSPPYLFIPGSRPEITKAPASMNYGEKVTIEVKNLTGKGSLVLCKLGASTHGLDAGQRLTDLEFKANRDKGVVTFTAPTNRHWCPPAYYMLFYVNDKGKPSKAAMVQLGAKGNKLLATALPRRKFIGWNNLPGVDGQNHSLSDLKGKEVVVVALVTNTCPKCVGYAEQLKTFATKYAGDKSKVGLVAINVAPAGSKAVYGDPQEESLKAMKVRAREEGLTFPYLLDKSQDVAWKNQVEYIPTFFVLNKEREITYWGEWDEINGAEKRNLVFNAVEKTLLGEEPQPRVTNPSGCPVLYARRDTK